MSKEFINCCTYSISQIILNLGPRKYLPTNINIENSIIELLRSNIYTALMIQSKYSNDPIYIEKMNIESKLYAKLIYDKAKLNMSKKEREEFSMAWAEML